MTKVAIVTAANAPYWELLQGLLASLAPAREILDFDLCVMDVGLTPDQGAALEEDGVRRLKPPWDIDFPDRDRAPEHFKAMVCRPFIPHHFPGYRTYLWIDADAWVQDFSVLDIYLSGAERGQIALASQVDRAYKGFYKRQKLFGWTHNHKHYRLGWGWRVADKFGRNPVLNSGAFALHGDAPHWTCWAETLRQGLQRTRHRLVEQTALNLVIYRDRLPATFLPAYCNWLCDAARPKVDDETGLLVEPHAPYQPIGIVHLAGEFERVAALDLETVAGRTVQVPLNYGQWSSNRNQLILHPS